MDSPTSPDSDGAQEREVGGEKKGTIIPSDPLLDDDKQKVEVTVCWTSLSNS